LVMPPKSYFLQDRRRRRGSRRQRQRQEEEGEDDNEQQREGEENRRYDESIIGRHTVDVAVGSSKDNSLRRRVGLYQGEGKIKMRKNCHDDSIPSVVL